MAWHRIAYTHLELFVLASRWMGSCSFLVGAKADGGMREEGNRGKAESSYSFCVLLLLQLGDVVRGGLIGNSDAA